MQALIATRDSLWRSRYLDLLRSEDWEVHLAFAGFDALDKMRRLRFEIVIVDDSLPDMGALELSLSVPEAAAHVPRVLVAAANLQDKFRRIERQLPHIFAGSHAAVHRRLQEITRKSACAPSLTSQA